MNHLQPTRRARRRGFTLIEIIISVALMAALAVASAAAMAAASRSAQAGDDFLRASRTASRVLDSIVADAHGASAVQVISATTLQLVRDDDSVVQYRYDAATRQIRLTRNNGVTTTDNTLAREIDGVAFAAVVEPDPSTHVNRVVQVTTTLTIADANKPTTALTASANCRRKRTYR